MRRLKHVALLALALWLPVLVANIWLIPQLPSAIQSRLSVAVTSLLIIVACLSNVAVVHDAMQRHAGAAHATKRELMAARARYVRLMAQRYRYLAFDRIPGTLRDSRPLPLLELYVSPRLAPWSSNFTHDSSLNSIATPITSIVANSRRVVIVGESGSGKTALLRYLTLAFASRASHGAASKSSRLLPIYIPLDEAAKYSDLITSRPIGRHFDSPVLSWGTELGYLVQSLMRSDLRLPPGFFEHFLRKGDGLILLDGLDQIGDQSDRSAVQRMIEDLSAYVHDLNANNRIIVTTRVGNLGAEPLSGDFETFELMPFSPTEMSALLKAWQEAGLPGDRTQLDNVLGGLQLSALSPRELRLAVNPLYLTILILVHRRTGRTPNQKAMLYKEIVDGVFLRGADDREIKELYLEQLAFWMQLKSTAVTRKDITQKLAALLRERDYLGAADALRQSHEFMDWALRGLLVTTETGVCRFVHPTFQEYLAAQDTLRRFHERPEDYAIVRDTVLEHLHEPSWQDVHLFLVSQLDGATASRIVEEVLERKTEYGDLYPRDLLMALRFLGEDAPVDIGLQDRILDDLFARIFSKRLEVGWRSGLLNSYCRAVLPVLHDMRGSRAESALVMRLLVQIADRDARSGVRARAVEWLGHLRNPDSRIVQALQSALSDPNPAIQDRARKSLSIISQDHEQVAASIERLVLDVHQSETVRVHAARILIHLGRLPTVTLAIALRLPTIGEAVETQCQARVRGHLLKEWVSCVTAQTSSPHDRSTIQASASPLLALGLESWSSSTRILVAWAAGKLGCSHESIVAALIQASKDDEPQVREQAIWALGECSISSPLILRSLINGLRDPESRVHHAAVRALTKVGWGGQG